MDSRDKFAQMLREGYETLDPEKEQREYIRELLLQCLLIFFSII